jgi:hypothetical protein
MGPGAFADGVDALLNDSARFVALAGALLAAHVFVAIEAIARRRVSRLAASLNLAFAATILLYKASQYAGYPGLIDVARDHLASSTDMRFILFETAVAIAAGFALAGWRVAAWLSVAALAVNALGVAAMLLFVLTFHLERLI